MPAWQAVTASDDTDKDVTADDGEDDDCSDDDVADDFEEGDVENCEAQDHDLERDELQYDDVKDGGSAEVEGNVSGLLWQDRCSGAWLGALCRMWKRATK